MNFYFVCVSAGAQDKTLNSKNRDLPNCRTYSQRDSTVHNAVSHATVLDRNIQKLVQLDKLQAFSNSFSSAKKASDFFAGAPTLSS